ncbi:MAG: ABC transporter permease subunit [Thermofilum sp.]|jgi:NitT/TauT family transport system permease protein|nr:ABC transporter permease subunit [Thermofilum sp.]
MGILDLIIAMGYSLARMLVAYIISVLLALLVGSAMARNKLIEAVTLPILDILQSIPILGFFPVVLVFFVGNLPKPFGLEASAVFLIITSLVWNMIFGVYASIKSLDPSIFDMAQVYSFGPASKFFYIYTPASKSALLANTLVSWAGGWFFLTSAEVISLGEEEYKLKGIGTFILESFNSGDYSSFYMGVGGLILLILLTYIILWNPATVSLRTLPLLSIKIVYENLSTIVSKLWNLIEEVFIFIEKKVTVPKFLSKVIELFFTVVIFYYLLNGFTGLLSSDIYDVALNFARELPTSFFHVSLILIISLLLSLGISYATYIGREMGSIFTLSGELLASIPAIIWWPLLAQIALASSLGPYLVSLIVLLQGAAWYLFFNIIIFGLSSIRREHEELAQIYKIKGWYFVRTVFLPSIFPAVASGLLSAWGGAWNATIVAEYVVLSGRTFDMGGVGALLNRYTVEGKTTEVALTALLLSLVIVIINKVVWSRIFSRISGAFAGE